MIVLKFQRFGTLWAYNGIPVYVGQRCITRSRPVWWWPVNWIALPLIIPFAAWLAWRKRHPTPPQERE